MPDATHDPEFLNGFSLDDLLAAAANKARYMQRSKDSYKELYQSMSRKAERLEDKVADLEDELDDKPPRDLERLFTVVHHLLHATGVYDLADLKDAALDLGMEIV